MPGVTLGNTPAYLVQVGFSYALCQAYARKLVSMEKRVKKKLNADAEREYLITRQWQMQNCLKNVESQSDEALMKAFEIFGVTAKTPALFGEIEASDRLIGLLEKAVEEKRSRGEMTFPGRAPAR